MSFRWREYCTSGSLFPARSRLFYLEIELATAARAER